MVFVISIINSISYDKSFLTVPLSCLLIDPGIDIEDTEFARPCLLTDPGIDSEDTEPARPCLSTDPGIDIKDTEPAKSCLLILPLSASFSALALNGLLSAI